jgi:hypothetical protein
VTIGHRSSKKHHRTKKVEMMNTTPDSAVARAKALQHLAPLRCKAILRRLKISQDDVGFVAGRSQAHVGSVLNRRIPLEEDVADAIVILVGNRATRDELFGSTS